MVLKSGIIPPMQNVQRQFYGDSTEMTYGVQMLLIANVAIFLLEWIFGLRLSGLLALRSDWWTHFGLWELLTYQFVHQGFWHLFSNMLGLYFLGPETERAIGTNRFFMLYLLSGVLGGFGWSLLSPAGIHCVGASGSVFGVLGAYAALYPHRKLMLIIFPFFPIKAWILVSIFAVFEFSNSLKGGGTHVANAAHLGGGIAGYIYATVTGRPDVMRRLKKYFSEKEKPPVDSREIDRILDKASREGFGELTHRERDLLKRAGKQQDTPR